MGHGPIMFVTELREFPSKPCLAGKHFLIARVSMSLKSRDLPDMLLSASVTRKVLQFGT